MIINKTTIYTQKAFNIAGFIGIDIFFVSLQTQNAPPFNVLVKSIQSL